MKRLRDLLLCGTLVLVGLVTSLWYGPSLILEARASHSWPSVEGRVVEARLTESRSKGRTKYRVSVTYRYEVDGQGYSGDRWSVPGDLRVASRAEGEATAASFVPGDSIPVYYDPDDPADAVLEPGGDGTAWVVLGFGLFLLGGGIWIGWRRLT